MDYFADIQKDWEPGENCELYYKSAEASEAIQLFWGDDSVFLKLFRRLDLSVLAELACGRGRHAEHILRRFPVVTMILLDLVPGNIEFCKKRFAQDGVTAYRNNGDDFFPVGDGQLTALFCYDAMVHFEYDTVFSYLRDTVRVLAPGGRALFHHSNYTAGPGNLYRQNPHWRNFMSQELFAHAANRSGLRVLEQAVLPWGGVSNLDCLTLLESAK